MRHLHWLDSRAETAEVATTCREVLGVDIHPLALEHLVEGAIRSEMAFPRLERHDNYLFGTFFLPSNVENPSADCDSIVFVATHDAVVATSGVHSTSQRNWSQDRTRLLEIDTTDSTPDGGQFILNALRLSVEDLIADARMIRTFLSSRVEKLTAGVDLTKNISDIGHGAMLPTKKRRDLLRQLTEILPTSNAIAAQLPVMQRIAGETSKILQSLVDNDERRDLQIDLRGDKRELFSRYLEIFLTDLLLDSRQLVAMLDDIRNLVDSIIDRARQLREEENVAAGRFTGAIASIMLLPTFIVGLYGQNFAEMPETDWRYGYLFSWGTIIALTVFQVMFFRRRRWI
ncbi:MAG: magnesium transporter CorA family protein [Actinomycetota bacterium]